MTLYEMFQDLLQILFPASFLTNYQFISDFMIFFAMFTFLYMLFAGIWNTSKGMLKM